MVARQHELRLDPVHDRYKAIADLQAVEILDGKEDVMPIGSKCTSGVDLRRARSTTASRVSRLRKATTPARKRTRSVTPSC